MARATRRLSPPGRALLACTGLMVVCSALAVTGPAMARDVSGSELGAILDSASSDAAIERLGDVSSVDGVPFDLSTVIAGADAEQAGMRLEELRLSVASDAPPRPSAEELRDRARQLFGSADRPRAEQPTGGGQSDGGGISISVGVPFGIGLALALIAIAVGILLARVVVRRQTVEAGGPRTRSDGRAGGGEPSAVALEREAERAEGGGEWRKAVRLRFQAGLMRLDDASAIELRPSLTAAAAAREVRSPTLSELERDYERIAFGGGLASSGDVARHRAGWRRILNEVGAG